MKNNQAEQILRLIRDSGDRGVENYKLADISLKYSSRISELRQDGYDIRARRIWRDGKASGTFVYYIEPDKQPPSFKTLEEAKSHIEAFSPESTPSQTAIPWMDD